MQGIWRLTDVSAHGGDSRRNGLPDAAGGRAGKLTRSNRKPDALVMSSNAATASADRDFTRMEGILRRASLPPLPKVACTLLRLFNDPDATVHEIAGVVRVDPALALRVLKVANSPLFGQRSRVTTVERAMVVLGLNYVKTISLATQLTTPLRKIQSPGVDMDSFWRDALLRACLSRRLAQASRRLDSEIAFLIGLTLDFGIPVLAGQMGAAYAEGLARVGKMPIEINEWERRTLGFTHADVAGAMLRAWNLPDELILPVESHHLAVESASCTPANDMHLLACYVGALPLGIECVATASQTHRIVHEQMTRRLDVTHETMGSALRASKAEFEMLASLFEDLLPENCEIEEALASACAVFSGVDAKVFHALFAGPEQTAG